MRHHSHHVVFLHQSRERDEGKHIPSLSSTKRASFELAGLVLDWLVLNTRHLEFPRAHYEANWIAFQLEVLLTEATYQLQQCVLLI